MFDFSWTEIALIGGVALVVIGPKDLPRALRTAGIWVRKARSISREFQGTIEQMMREAELDDVKKTIEKATSFNVEDEIKKHIDPTGDLAEALKPPEMPDFEKLVSGTDEKPAVPPQSVEPGETAAIEPPPSAEEAPDPLPSEPLAAEAPPPEPLPTEPWAPEPGTDAAPLVHLGTPPEPPVKPAAGETR